MNAPRFSRRDALRALAASPVLLPLRMHAGRREDFAAALAGDPRFLAFANPTAPRLAAPFTTVAGHLPPELTGTLWRNGPAEHERFGHRYGHWFDGDGMVQACTFDGTGATHRSRILDTPKRRRETRAGRRLLPAFGTLPPDPGPVTGADDMNVANTSMLAHADRLLALWEGGSALEVDSETLSCRGFVDWRDDLAGLPFSAHPKRDVDGTVWNIGVLTNPSPMLLLYRIDPKGGLAAFRPLPVDPLGMVHDFVVTTRHLAVLLAPFVVEPERFASGRTSFLDAHAWRPELGTRVLVVDKDTLSTVRRHTLPAGFHFHHGNGWTERDGTIHLDVCQAADPDFVVRDLRAPMHGAWSFRSAQPRYRRIVLPARGTARIEDAAPGTADFPRIDPRWVGRRHRRVFALHGPDAGRPDSDAPSAHGGWMLQAIASMHPDGGVIDRWAYPPQRIPEEHVFVPRGTAEGDGWLLGPFLDVERRAAGTHVFDARRLSDGPLWEGVLPYPVPLALHGTFVRS